ALLAAACGTETLAALSGTAHRYPYFAQAPPPPASHAAPPPPLPADPLTAAAPAPAAAPAAALFGGRPGRPAPAHPHPMPAPTPAAAASPTETDPAAPVAHLVTGFTDAGCALLGRPGTEHLVFSPLSIGHALLMARGAADDSTGRAIDARFDLPEDRAAHQAW